LVDLSAAQSAARNAVVKGTAAKQIRARDRYKQYLVSIGLFDDWYLENFSRGGRNKILSAFAQSIREGRFGARYLKHVKSNSVRTALDGAAQAYKLANRPDLRLDEDGKLAFILQCQLRGYSVVDEPETPQVAITASILQKFYSVSISPVPVDKTLCELFIGAFFCVMRSCKYVRVTGLRKAKLLTLNNIKLLKGQRAIQYSDLTLNQADCVTIMFKLQKKRLKTS
jgi:hypothetical protein